MSPPRLWPLTDCITNYRLVLSSDRAPQDEEQSKIFGKKKEKEKSGHRFQRCPTPRHTDWLIVSRKQLRLRNHAAEDHGQCHESLNQLWESNPKRLERKTKPVRPKMPLTTLPAIMRTRTRRGASSSQRGPRVLWPWQTRGQYPHSGLLRSPISVSGSIIGTLTLHNRHVSKKKKPHLFAVLWQQLPTFEKWNKPVYTTISLHRNPTRSFRAGILR
jgi:hypothetical protein